MKPFLQFLGACLLVTLALCVVVLLWFVWLAHAGH